MKSFNMNVAVYTLAESWKELNWHAAKILAGSYGRKWPDRRRTKQWHTRNRWRSMDCISEVEAWIAQCAKDCETNEQLNDDYYYLCFG